MLTLPQILRAKELSVREGVPKKDTAVILVWLDGGPSQFETYDPKIEAPVEYRSFWGATSTNVPGINISDQLPLHAKIADRFSIVRSLHHEHSGHYEGCHYILTGNDAGPFASVENREARNPSIGSTAAKLSGANAPGMPPYVAIPIANSQGERPGYFGAHFLGRSYNPFEVGGDGMGRELRKVRDVSLPEGISLDRVSNRVKLSRQFDGLRRAVDRAGDEDALDHFQQQAYEMVSSNRARNAFDISREDPRVQDRYGRDRWGKVVLMARRLVEAGSLFVVAHLGVNQWDHHINLESRLEYRLPRLDRVVSALVEDLDSRGLSDRVMFLVVGEFGRTPLINNGQSGSSQGTPGRDHWPNAMSCMLGGGGLKVGQVVGSTTPRGEFPKDRPLRPEDLAATIYHVLGIDPNISFPDDFGTMIPILPGGQPIAELV